MSDRKDEVSKDGTGTAPALEPEEKSGPNNGSNGGNVKTKSVAPAVRVSGPTNQSNGGN